MFQAFSAAVPTPCPTSSQTVETRSKSAVFSAQKRGGRAGEIRTRGLLVPNRRLRPTVFSLILALETQSAASLLIPRFWVRSLLDHQHGVRRGILGRCLRLTRSAQVDVASYDNAQGVQPSRSPLLTN